MRRPPGLYQRGEVWYCKKTVRAAGRVRELRCSLGTSSLEEAVGILTRMVEEARQELIHGPAVQERTFREAAVEYALALERRGKDPARAAQDLRMLDPWIGALPLSHVHQGALAALEADARGRIASGTLRRAYRTAVAVLNHAARVLRDGNRPWLAHAVPKIVAPEWGDERQPYPLTWEEQDRLVDLLPPHLQAPVLFAVYTGARQEEIASLRWKQAVRAPGAPSWALWWIPPDQRKGRAAAAPREQEGRYVVAPRAARSVVEGQVGKDAEFVFPAPEREGRTTARVVAFNNTAWRRVVKAAGLAIRFHDLRHTAGERMEAAGIPWEYRKVLLGHHLPDITHHYSAPGLARLLEMAERVTRETAPVLRPVLMAGTKN